jgi:hypothetical protein
MLPYRGRFDSNEGSTPNDGKEKADRRIDGTATRALRVLTSGMHGGLTSPSQKWFRLSLVDTELSRVNPVRRWLDMIEGRIYDAFRRSNFYQAVQNVYLETAGFGTACLYSESHSSGRGVWFKVITVGDYMISANPQGRIDTVMRRDWMTAKQIVQAFGMDNVSDFVKKTYERSPYAFIEVRHSVKTRLDRNARMIDNKNKPIESIYWELTNQDNFLSESGFDDFPYAVSRWDVNGSNAYGYGPGMDALPDVRGVNAVSEDLQIAVNKEIDPPVNVPDSIIDRVDLLPGGRNPSSGNEQVTATYQISPNLSAGSTLLEGMKRDISDWFYTPLFILAANPNATATEIIRKNEEQLIQLGPVIQRMFNELLDPVIERSFKILLNQGMIPEPPPEISGEDINIEYISSLAQAQKMIGVQKMERHLGFVGNLAQINPEILDNVDFDAAVRLYGEEVGVPAVIQRSKMEVDAIRQKRNMQMQQQQQIQNANVQAQTAATLSNAKLGDDNVLSQLAEEGAAA